MKQREIKFRAWTDKGTKGTFRMEMDVGLLSADNFNEWNENGHGLFLKPRTRHILMQYTGLKDKKGVEIYEGDVVRMLYTDWGSQGKNDKRTLEQYLKDISSIGVVVFEDAKFCLKFGERQGSLFEGTHGQKEVIGNIYENKELLNNK